MQPRSGLPSGQGSSVIPMPVATIPSSVVSGGSVVPGAAVVSGASVVSLACVVSGADVSDGSSFVHAATTSANAPNNAIHRIALFLKVSLLSRPISLFTCPAQGISTRTGRLSSSSGCESRSRTAPEARTPKTPL